MTLVQVAADDGSRFDDLLTVLMNDAATVRQRHPQLQIRSELIPGEVPDHLAALSSAGSITVVGTHRRRPGLARHAQTMGARLAGIARGPVAIVPESNAPGRHGVVAGVDGGDAAESALGLAAEVCARTGEDLRIIHAVGGELSPIERRARGRLVDEALRLTRERHPGLVVRAAVVGGDVPAVLRDAARSASLLAVGNHNGRPVHDEDWLLGSVSNALATRLLTPTLIVPASP